MVGDLKSKTLDLDDLGVLVGAPPGTGPGETASVEQEQKAAQEAAAKAPVLPDKQFDVPELQAFDARISFTGDTVQAMKLPLEHMEAKITLEDGHIKIDPARLDVAGGKLETRVGLSAPSGVLNGDLDLTLRNVKLNQLLAAFRSTSARSRWKRRASVRSVAKPSSRSRVTRSATWPLRPRRARCDHGRRADQCADHRGARAGCG